MDGCGVKKGYGIRGLTINVSRMACTLFILPWLKPGTPGLSNKKHQFGLPIIKKQVMPTLRRGLAPSVDDALQAGKWHANYSCGFRRQQGYATLPLWASLLKQTTAEKGGHTGQQLKHIAKQLAKTSQR